MDPSEKASHVRKESGTQSVGSKIREDLISQGMNIEPPLRNAKSYENPSEEQNGEREISDQHKEQVKKAFTEQIGSIHHTQMKEHPKSKSKQFSQQIISSSQSVSLNELSLLSYENPGNQEKNVEKKLLNQRKKITYFNVMLVGAEETGKTTFLKCYLRNYRRKRKQRLIQEHTDQIHENQIPASFVKSSMRMSILDTPGFDKDSFEEYCGLVEKQIQKRIEQYKQANRRVMRESSVYRNDETNLVDPRVHCVLYFLKGPRLNQYDWKLLSELQKIVNIIPIISKCDNYTVGEIRQFKQVVKQKLRETQIKWFDIEEYLRQKHPEELKNLLNSSYGAAPPFAISASIAQVQSDMGPRAGREYLWGTCFTQNPKHTDFVLLTRLLTIFLKDGMVKYTNIKSEKGYEIMKQKQTSQLKRKIIGFGLGAVALTAIVYKFNKVKDFLKGSS